MPSPLEGRILDAHRRDPNPHPAIVARLERLEAGGGTATAVAYDDTEIRADVAELRADVDGVQEQITQTVNAALEAYEPPAPPIPYLQINQVAQSHALRAARMAR